jgi:hypothetical protein
MGHILLDLKDKTAVVIGGTSGIGLALAKELAEAGANVVPTGRRAEQVRTAAAALEELGRRSLAVTCDVTDDASLEQLLEQVVSKFGSVEILVNCAGRTKRAPTLEFADTDWGRAQPCAGQTRDKHAKSPSDSFRVSYFTMLSEAIRATFLGVAEADKSTRAPAPLSKLCVGLKCGGSDGFSGISANPAVGHVSDLIASLGGRTILSEFPELCGVEQSLIDRSNSKEVGDRFIQLMCATMRRAARKGGTIRI